MGGVEPLTDRSQWPNVKLDFVLHAPLPKSSVGRKRKLRFRSCLEKGGGHYKKKPPPKGQLGSQNRCKKCKQLGHRQAGCPTNGVKKRSFILIQIFLTHIFSCNARVCNIVWIS